MDFYTETDIVNCSGAASIVREPQGVGVYSTSFIRLDEANNPCTLPVELISFDAKIRNEAVLLDWETASEQASSHFVVERSIDGKRFNKIGTIEAVGESTLSVIYGFSDDNPLSGRNYYRLKMVDLDGSFEYSEVRQVTFKNSRQVSIYPTNVQSSVTIAFHQIPTDDVHITIYDFTGRQVLQNTIPAHQSAFQLDMNSFNSGTFIIKVQGQGIDYSTKIIKE